MSRRIFSMMTQEQQPKTYDCQLAKEVECVLILISAKGTEERSATLCKKRSASHKAIRPSTRNGPMKTATCISVNS